MGATSESVGKTWVVFALRLCHCGGQLHKRKNVRSLLWAEFFVHVFFSFLGYIRQLEMFPTRLMTTKNLKLWEIRRLFLDAVVYQRTKLYRWIIFYGSLILVLYQVPGNFCPYLKQNTRSMHFDVCKQAFGWEQKRRRFKVSVIVSMERDMLQFLGGWQALDSKFFEFQCNHFFVFCTNSWILGKVKNVQKTSNGTWDVKACIVIEASFTVHHTFFEPHACLLYDSNHPPSFWKYSLHPEIM